MTTPKFYEARKMRVFLNGIEISPAFDSGCRYVGPGTIEVQPIAGVLPVERHNATCRHCGGPAFEGLGLPRCERVGGCLGPIETREPNDFQVIPAFRRGGEVCWYVAGRGDFATRDLAVAAWRATLRR